MKGSRDRGVARFVNGCTAMPAPVPPIVAPAPVVSASDTTVAAARAPRVAASLDEGVAVEGQDLSLSLHFLGQTRFEEATVGSARATTFRVPMARPAIRGAIARPWLTFFVQSELAGSSSQGAATLLDAELTLHPAPEVGLKVGQFVTPFSRQFLVAPGALALPDFAPSNVAFRRGRDTGAMLLGQVAARRVEWWMGAFNGNGIDKGGNDDATLEGIGRLVVNALGAPVSTETPQLDGTAPRLSFGVSAAWNRATPARPAGATAAPAPAAQTTWGVDLAASAGVVALQAEGYLRATRASGQRPVSAAGAFAQLGVFVVPSTVELAARVDVLDLDVRRAGESAEGAGAVTYHLAKNHAKVSARYAEQRSTGEGASPRGRGFVVQTQLWF